MGRAQDRRSNSRERAGRTAAAGAPRRRAQKRARRRAGDDTPRVGWSRRVGIAVALLIAGVSVVFAGQALLPGATPGGPADGSPRTPTAPTTTLTLPQAPLLALPVAPLTREPIAAISGQLIEDLPRDGSHRLRVYVNSEKVRDRRLPRRDEFTINNVPLVEGNNSITLAISGPLGEGLHSAPIEIELDSTAPTIELLAPATGQTIYAPQALLRGTSEGGATLRVENLATGASDELLIPDDGTFELAVDLLAGFNELLLEARDPAGNEARSRLTVERREGAASVRLSMSRTRLQQSALPTSISLEVEVRDESSAPVDGAEVVFSLSPPGLPTITYNAITVDGVARWPSVRISDDAQVGQGLATVMVTLAGGATLTDSVFFTIE